MRRYANLLEIGYFVKVGQVEQVVDMFQTGLTGKIIIYSCAAICDVIFMTIVSGRP